MTGIDQLWLPILLSAVFVFVASSIVHMALPWHKGDYSKLPKEDDFRAALRAIGAAPGDYIVPRPQSMKESGSPEHKEKVKAGPNVVMTIMPNQQVGMGASLAYWFIYAAVIAAASGFIAGTVLPNGAKYFQVFHLVALVAFLGYSGALWQITIWYKRSWVTTLKSTIDGLLYACLTAGTMGWLWPR